MLALAFNNKKRDLGTVPLNGHLDLWKAKTTLSKLLSITAITMCVRPMVVNGQGKQRLLKLMSPFHYMAADNIKSVPGMRHCSQVSERLQTRLHCGHRTIFLLLCIRALHCGHRTGIPATLYQSSAISDC